jgi:hypothetical protein
MPSPPICLGPSPVKKSEPRVLVTSVVFAQIVFLPGHEHFSEAD